MRSGVDKFFERHPELKDAYPSVYGRNESLDAVGEEIHRLTEYVASLERTISRQFVVPKDNVCNDAVISVPAEGKSDWMTLDEVCDEFKLSKNSVKSRAWREENGFPYRQDAGVYGSVAYHRQKVQEWIDSQSEC